MKRVSIIGIDLAKNGFQLHGAQADGTVSFRKKLSRSKLLDFLALQPRCVVAMEACASAHYWGRETEKLGHEVKLIPPIYVEPFVKRHKNDVADAEATCEAAQHPTMSVVAVKTEEQQARGMLLRTRDLLVRQRTQTINALRGHLAEFGIVAAQGPAFAPAMESFRRGRDFSAWLGLVPKQYTTGGKPRLGKISKMGQRDLRRLLVIGAMAEVSWAVRRGKTKDPWLAGMLERKPRKLVAVALANRTARIIWALTTKKDIYRAPAAA